jgi:SAM-dependent methyltransferase
MNQQLSSKEQDRLYDRRYYFGETSGYSADGYGECHPDWSAWLEFLEQVQPSGRLLDLGCAYGFLVRDARERGYEAFGLDISSYALQQRAGLKPGLVRGTCADLPFGSDSMDIVLLFDVLEHLGDPVKALVEAVRVLTSGGLLVGSTPDPLFFKGKEETHIFERPPSFWVDALRKLGLSVQFRFSGEAFYFQFIAAFPGTKAEKHLTLFQHDYFEAKPDFIETEGPLRMVPRFGWETLHNRSRQMTQQSALYLLNPLEEPIQIDLSLDLSHSVDSFSSLRVRFNSLPLLEVNLTSERKQHQLRLPSIQVPSGGHHLFFEITGGADTITVANIEVKQTAGSKSQLVEALPFDLYQRYRLSGQVCDILETPSVLDIGGVLGDQDGHLACSRDFLSSGRPDREVLTTDLRHCDVPNHMPAAGDKQPFPNESFDTVLSLDVLEHLPSTAREPFLREMVRLARRFVVIGAPTASEDTIRLEESLAQSLMGEQDFLKEHREMGLPEASEVEAFFTGEGWEVQALPNGYLPRWASMQAFTQFVFGLRDLQAFQSVNRQYNRTIYPHDQVKPAYRTIWVAARSPLSEVEKARLQSLLSEQAEAVSLDSSLLSQASLLKAFKSLRAVVESKDRSLDDVQFLAGERQKLIHRMEEEVSWLKREIDRWEKAPSWKVVLRKWKKAFRRDNPGSGDSED